MFHLIETGVFDEALLHLACKRAVRGCRDARTRDPLRARERPAEGRAATTRLTPWPKNSPTMAGQTEVAVLCSQDFPVRGADLAGGEVAATFRTSDNSAHAKFYCWPSAFDT